MVVESGFDDDGSDGGLGVSGSGSERVEVVDLRMT